MTKPAASAIRLIWSRRRLVLDGRRRPYARRRIHPTRWPEGNRAAGPSGTVCGGNEKHTVLRTVQRSSQTSITPNTRGTGATKFSGTWGRTWTALERRVNTGQSAVRTTFSAMWSGLAHTSPLCKASDSSSRGAHAADATRHQTGLLTHMQNGRGPAGLTEIGRTENASNLHGMLFVICKTEALARPCVVRDGQECAAYAATSSPNNRFDHQPATRIAAGTNAMTR